MLGTHAESAAGKYRKKPVAAMEPLERRRMLSATPFLTEVDLVSDQHAIGSNPADGDLINPWGVSFGTRTPFWVSDNGTGVATLYNSLGAKQGLRVTIDAPPSEGPGATSAPTGQVFNTDPNTNGFLVSNKTHTQTGPAVFIFVTEDGTVDAWNPNVGKVSSGPSTEAFITVDQSVSQNSVFKGAALGVAGGNTNLYVTDFRNAKIDAFNDQWGPASITGDFSDPRIPRGYAPFNISNIGGNLVVTYAKQDDAKHDDDPGAGHGFVDIFNTNGDLLLRFKHTGALNSPWGVVQVPPSMAWGSLVGDYLVGQFGSGRIAIYKPNGHFAGLVDGPDGKPITIDGLWTLTFGGGGANNGASDQLFFTAGPGGEKHGLFGELNIGFHKNGDDQNQDGDGDSLEDLLGQS
jgi:uncharacterized protein (TIGR03118 family)